MTVPAEVAAALSSLAGVVNAIVVDHAKLASEVSAASQDAADSAAAINAFTATLAVPAA